MLEVVFTRPKRWSKSHLSGYWTIPGNPTSLRIVFDVAGHLTGCWIEVAEDEFLHFSETYTVTANFLTTPEFWEEIKDRIYIGMEMNAYAGSEIIGKAKLLGYEYYESYDIVDGKVIVKE